MHHRGLKLGKHSKNNKSNKSGKLLNILIVILIVILVISGYNLFRILYRYYAGTKTYNEVADFAKNGSDDTGIDWDKLKGKYKDIKAWIYQEDTVINYPIVQGKDNSYYLDRLINGKYNVKGTLFIDCRVEHPFEDFLTVVYGHRMKDRSMFWTLGDYRDDPDYCKNHPVMYISVPGDEYTLEIFAACTIPADSPRYEFSFPTVEDRERYLAWIEKNTELNTDVEVTARDNIVMLSTCTYEFNNARIAVFGKLTERDG